jgi:hypothetical protein
MGLNVQPSDIATVLAAVNPASQGAGAVSTGYIDVSGYESLLADVLVGVFGASATVDAKLEQATSSGGAGVKDVTGKAITQLVAAGGNNRQARINCESAELDTNNGFKFVRLTITVGTAATLIGGALYGVGARYQPASQAASVAQVVS